MWVKRACIWGLLTSMLVAAVLSCRAPQSADLPVEVWTVKAAPVQNTLHFSGALEPITATEVSSPIAGTIQAMHVHYGQTVAAKQALFSLTSPAFEKQFADAVTDYLRLKEATLQGQDKVSADRALFEAGVIARNDWQRSKTDLETQSVQYVQATHRLQQLAAKAKLDFAVFAKIRMQALAQVAELLSQPHVIEVRAPVAGVLYQPMRSQGKTETPLTVGQHVEEGARLATLGALCGVKIKIQVSERHIDQLQQGMQAEVQLDADQTLVLQGALGSVQVSTLPADLGAAPHQAVQFPVYVNIQQLTAAQQQRLHPGMHVKVTVKLAKRTQIVIPLAAIQGEAGQPWVQVVDAEGQAQRRQTVVLGETTPQGIVVLKGLQGGETIAVLPE